MKNSPLTISSHREMAAARSFPATNKPITQPLTMKSTSIDNNHPSTMINEINAPSGGWGSHWIKDARRKQILQIKATRERSLSIRIFGQKSAFLDKIPLFCRE
jgi:hypothetical protein